MTGGTKNERESEANQEFAKGVEKTNSKEDYKEDLPPVAVSFSRNSFLFGEEWLIEYPPFFD